jgi:hypothetical protein
MQLKMGGKFHLKLNIGERPIANKYREGKMKRTLERELNSTWNCWKGNAWSQSRRPGINLAFAWCTFWFDGSASILTIGKRSRECGIFGCVYSPWPHTMVGIEELSTPCLGCWQNGFNRPVLKHGPRSLTCLRVFGWKTRARNESEKLRSLSWGASTPGPDLLWRFRGRACMLGPERWWTMPE